MNPFRHIPWWRCILCSWTQFLFCHSNWADCGSEPVYELVLLQVSTATGDVSGHLQQLQHGERGRLALITAHLQLVQITKIIVFIYFKQRRTQSCRVDVPLVACSVSGRFSCLLQSSVPVRWSVAGCSGWRRRSGQCSHDWTCCEDKRRKQQDWFSRAAHLTI